MFDPPQGLVGLALLPVVWAANDRANGGRRPAERSNDDDLVRYFPAAWTRESLPDAPAGAVAWLKRVYGAWQARALVWAARRWLRRWAPSPRA